jgi:putative DNA primase/helicase
VTADQVWAEALAKYRAGEKPFLEVAMEEKAQGAQLEVLESDDQEDLVREYLEKLLPANWGELGLYARRDFLRGDGFSDGFVGEMRREQVCTLEIWCELFGKGAAVLRKIDSYEINAILRKIEGWKLSDNMVRFPLYGRQRVFIRVGHGGEQK